MAISNAFVWGKGGAQLTPEQIARQREIEDALVQRGVDTSPVGSPWEGLARVANAAAGSFRRGRLIRAERENKAYDDEAFGKVVGILNGGSSGAPPAVPMTGAAAEVGSGAPVAVNAPTFANDGTELGAYLSDPERRATLPAGMRNNNPGNIKFVGQKVPGIVGPSVNTDQGDPQAVFDSPESGMRAMYSLLGKKYAGGKLTPNQMIAGDMGWTPGNYQAAANVARYAGIGPDDDIGFSDPTRAAKFMRGLILQEHGNRGALYPEGMISSAIGGQPVQVASAAPQTATDAINAIAPSQPAVETAYAPALPPPTTVGAPPPVASVPPLQVAQAAPPVVTAPNGAPIPPEVLKVLGDPRISQRTRGIAELLIKQQQARQQAILEQQIKQADPAYQADLRLKNAQYDQIANPRISPSDQANLDFNREKFTADQQSNADRLALDKDKFAADKANNALTPDIKEYDAYAKDERDAGRTPMGRLDYQLAVKKAGAANTTVNTGEGSKFYNTLDEQNAKTFATLSDGGIQARGKLAQINRLEGLMQNAPQGGEGYIKQVAGDWGIPTEGLSDIQAASALIERLVPQQRQPGSGPMSDADLAGFKRSLPRIINQPGGNQLIFQTLRGITQYEIEMGAIADRVANREINPSEARRQIQELRNPLGDFKISDGPTPNGGTTSSGIKWGVEQ